MKSQNAQFTCARLTSGRVVKLTKDCECRTHGGSHWQETDHAWKAANRAALGENPSTLALLGYASEESARLAELSRAFASNEIAQLLTDDDCAALRAGGEAVNLSRQGLRPYLRRVLGYSMAEADRQLGGRTLAAFRAVWEWSAPRMGGTAGDKHDRFWKTHGKAAYYARIAKVRAACGFAALKGAS